MKRTPLYNEHLGLQGKIVDFAGWELPVQYASILEEHICCRTAAALFDVSHMGEISVKGRDAAAFLRSMIPTSLDRIEPYRCMYSCLCSGEGGVLDDFFVYMIGEEDFLLVVNAATIDKDFRWLTAHRQGDVDIENLSSFLSKIDLQGPVSKQILLQVFPDERVESLERFSFLVSEYASRPIFISRTGYTGEAGYELYLHNECAVRLWRELLSKGKDFGIRPAGLGARDTLRLEACYSLYGHELSESISPVEAGIGWIVNSKDNYIGKEILTHQKKNGAPREMVAIELTGKGIPRENCPVTRNDVTIGMTTSGGYSPTFRKGIALALIDAKRTKIGDEVEIVIRGKGVKAHVVKRPFYPYQGGD